MVIVSLCIALPINFHGNMQGDDATFGHTTLSNIDPTSPWIWVHTVLLLSYLPVGGYVMRHFFRKVKYFIGNIEEIIKIQFLYSIILLIAYAIKLLKLYPV